LALLYRRHSLAPVGIGLLALGLADRLAFFTPFSAGFIVAGVIVLAVAALAPDPLAADHVGYPPLLLALCVVTAVAPLVPGGPDPATSGLTLAGGLAFYLCGAVPRLRPYRLWLSALLVIAAHAAIILRVPLPPHQDVWRFLNYGADLLLKGQDPYQNVIGPDGLLIRLTYPPAVVLLVAPFRLVLGDIRWAYVLCEAMVVVLLPRLISRAGGRVARWQEALILIPLALPRASQAFYVFSNHEWLLLALALGGLLLALDRRWLLAGLLLGLGIAAKQYFIVFPVLFLLPTLRFRVAAAAVGVAALVTVPFVLWGPAEFWDHVLGNLNNAPDPDRVTVWAMLVHAGLPGSRILAGLLALCGGVATLALAWIGRRSLDMQLMSCGLALFAFTLGATFAGYNYYVYGLVFLTWGLLISARQAPDPLMPPGTVVRNRRIPAKLL
jgi:hypothetical protein